MKHVIISVGTSLFTNYMKKGVKACYGNNDYINIEGNIDKLKNENYDGLNNLPSSKRASNAIKEAIRNKWIKGITREGIDDWKAGGNSYNIDACAEIKSFDKIQKQINDDYKIYLLTTDTALSHLAAEIIKEYIPKIFKSVKAVEICNIEGLQIYDYKEFDTKGLDKLFKKINAIKYEFENDLEKNGIKKNKRELISKNIILNISGGYKAIIPYLTIYGQLYDIPVYYIYEDSEELIKVPKFPVKFDWNFAEKYFPYIYNPNDMPLKLRNNLDELQQYHLLRKGNGEYGLTSFGNMLKTYITDNFPESKSVLGYFIEYKIYEYYLKYPYEKYIKVEHSIRKEYYPWLKDRELDLIMANKENNFIVGEIKSSYQFCDHNSDYKKNGKKVFEHVKSEIAKQIELMKTAEKIPDEYHLYIYSMSGDFIPFKTILENIREIKKLFDDCGWKFKAYTILTKFSYDVEIGGKIYHNDNLYQGFMSLPLKKEDIEEIKL